MPGANDRSDSRLSRTLWFVGLWAAGVLTLALAAGVLKLLFASLLH